MAQVCISITENGLAQPKRPRLSRKRMSREREESVNEKKNENELQDEVEITGEVESPADNIEELAEVEIQDIERELAVALEEVASLRDKMLRLAAESENFKKRMERERFAGLKYAGEQIFREILPVVDNLERAIGLGAVESMSPEKSLTALLEGVQLTLKSLKTTLDKFEVKSVDCVGQPFDPNKQEALTMEASDTVPASHVLYEFEKGYYYKDRLLRPARVVVSSGKAESQK